jgi:hypothetical protein
LIVFVGVLLALAADDIRETRSEASEARQSLGLLLEDVAADSASFASTATAHREEATWIAWLIENWARSELPADSLERAFWVLGTTSSTRLSRSAYSGLESANRLRLLRPDSLQHLIRRYYQDLQPGVEQFQTETRTLERQVGREHLGHYVVGQPGAVPGTMWPVADESVEFRTPWAEIQADVELHYLLVTLGRRMDSLSTRLSEGEVEAGRVLAAIRSVLGE